MSDLAKLIQDRVQVLSAESKLKAECVDFARLRYGTPVREFGPVAVKSTVEAAAAQIVAVHQALCSKSPLRYAIVHAGASAIGGKTYLTLRVAVEDTRPGPDRGKGVKPEAAYPSKQAFKDDDSFD